ncbi:MAG TPA: hypothetical protein VGH87_11125 [Polyangiaceae bacterium]
MPVDPFRDEATAASERVAALEGENEELRARLARLEDGDVGKLADEAATLERELAEAENAALLERMQLKELAETAHERPSPRFSWWMAQFAIAAFIAGITIGTWIGAR